jgi:hypothetical protein
VPFDSETAKEAGKKSKRGPATTLMTVRQMAKPEKVKQAFEMLEEMALKGEMKALELYLAYVCGKPTLFIEQNNSGLLTILRSGDNYSPIPSSPGTEEDSSEPQAI